MVNQNGVVIDIVYLVFATEPSKGGLCTNPGVGSCSIPSPGVYALHDTYTRGEHEFCEDDHETLAQTVGIAWDAWALTAVTQLNPQQQRERFEALECAVQSAGFALLLAVGTCVALSFEAMPGLCCFVSGCNTSGNDWFVC